MGFLDFTSYDTETWTTFFKDNWVVLVIALVVLLLVIRIVKTMVKWAIVAALVLGLVLYSGYTLDDVKNIGTKVMDDVKDIGSKVMGNVKEEALNAMVGDGKDAKYVLKEDGTYTVKTNNVELKGEVGASEVKVSVHGSPYATFPIDGVVQTFIDQAKQNG